MLKYFITATSIIVLANGKKLFVPKSHLYFDRIRTMLQSGCQDFNAVYKEFDLYAKVLELFPQYLTMNEQGHVVLKYCNDVDMERFVYETLRMNDEGKDPIGFLIMLAKAANNKIFTVNEIVKTIKDKGWVVSPAGDIVCYANIYNEGKIAKLSDNNKSTKVVSVDPERIQPYNDSYMTDTFTVIYDRAADEECLPRLEDTVVFGGDDLLNCF